MRLGIQIAGRLFQSRTVLAALVVGLAQAGAAGSALGSSPTPGTDHADDEIFVATISCSVACRGEREELLDLRKTFRPRELGLHPGDGSDGRGAPWGGFTATLEAWSRFACLDAASSSCGNLAAVERAEVVRVSSGTWTLDGRVLCPTPRQARLIDKHDRDPRPVFPGFTPVLSPFQEGSGAIRAATGDEDQPFALAVPKLGSVLEGPRDDPTQRPTDTYEYWERRAITFDEVPAGATTARAIRTQLLARAGVRSTGEYVEKMKRDHGIPPAEPCRTILRGRACFGDCLVFPGGGDMVQYLATNSLGPENLGELAVCGDNLAEFLATHEMSPSSREVYCEKYVTDSLIRGQSRAITCSSYRIRVDCSSLE